MVDKEYTFSDGTRIFNEKKNGRFQRFIEYDDNTIDVAFDGHPEATWNVD